MNVLSGFTETDILHKRPLNIPTERYKNPTIQPYIICHIVVFEFYKSCAHFRESHLFCSLSECLHETYKHMNEQI